MIVGSKSSTGAEKAVDIVQKAKTALKQIEDQVGDTRLKRKTTQASLFSGKSKP